MSYDRHVASIAILRRSMTANTSSSAAHDQRRVEIVTLCFVDFCSYWRWGPSPSGAPRCLKGGLGVARPPALFVRDLPRPGVAQRVELGVEVVARCCGERRRRRDDQALCQFLVAPKHLLEPVILVDRPPWFNPLPRSIASPRWWVSIMGTGAPASIAPTPPRMAGPAR